MREQGTVISVDVEVTSDALASPASSGASSLELESTADFPEQKRSVRLVDGDNKVTATYSDVNDSNNRLTGVTGVTGGPWPAGTKVVLVNSRRVFAQVKIDKEGEPIRARVPAHLVDKVGEGTRALCGETVTIEEDEDGNWHVTSIGETQDRPARPDAPVVDYDIAKRHGDINYRAKVSWSDIVEDVDGTTIDVDKYVVQMQATTDSAGNNPAEASGARRRKTYFQKDEDDKPGDDTIDVVFTQLAHPKKWYWKARVRAIDKNGKRSAWSEWSTPTMPASAFNDASVAISNVTFDVDQHRIHLDWDGPTDTDDTELEHAEVSHYQVELSQNTSFSPVFRRDRRVNVSRRSWRIKQPGSGNYYARIRMVDALGNKSLWYPRNGSGSGNHYITGNKLKPPKPQAPIVSAASGGSDGVLYRDGAKEKVKVVVRFTYGGGNWVRDNDDSTLSGSGTYAIDDDIDKFIVEWEQNNASTGFSGEPDKRSIVDIKPSQSGSQQVVKWKGRKVGRWLKVRYRAIDKKGHKSEFSDWSASFQVKEPRRLSAPTGIKVIGDKKAAEVKWTAPTTFVNGEAADETDISYYLVRLRTGSTSGPVVATTRTKNHQKRFRYTDADVELSETTYYATVDAIGHGGEGAVYDDGGSGNSGGSTTQTPVVSDSVTTGNVTSDGGTPAVMSAPIVTPSYKAMLIAWTRPGGTSDPLTYEVHRSTDNLNFSQVATTNDALTFTDTNLSTSVTYFYKLRARSRLSGNGSGNALSTAGSATTLSMPPADIISGNISATLTLSGGNLYVPTTNSSSTRTEILGNGQILCYSGSTLKMHFDGSNLKLYGGYIQGGEFTTSAPGAPNRLRMVDGSPDKIEWLNSSNSSQSSIRGNNNNLYLTANTSVIIEMGNGVPVFSVSSSAVQVSQLPLQMNGQNIQMGGGSVTGTAAVQADEINERSAGSDIALKNVILNQSDSWRPKWGGVDATVRTQDGNNHIPVRVFLGGSWVTRWLRLFS